MGSEWGVFAERGVGARCLGCLARRFGAGDGVVTDAVDYTGTSPYV